MVEKTAAGPFQQRFAYEASEDSKDRKPGPNRIVSSDDQLTKQKRKKLLANSRNVQQNFSVAAWAVRRHLDYVSRFSYESDTGDVGLDRDLEAWEAEVSQAGAFDVAGRHSRSRATRIGEARRTVDGDVWLILMSSGHTQWIESDRVRDPDNMARGQETAWKHGVKTSKGGRIRQVAIHKRDSRGNYSFERSIPARNAIQIGYFGEFDQYRGVSPLAAGINPLADVYEGFSYALAKAKVSQLFAVALSLADDSPLRDDDDGGDLPTGSSGFQVKMLDGGPDDDFSVIESKQPSSEFQNFTNLVLSAALKALDLPFSFYDESHTNFFGSRMAHVHYLQSCEAKREDLQEYLGRWFRWRLSLAVLSGDFMLPSGKTVADLSGKWVPAGTPWWRPLEEVRADELAVAAGFKTRSQVCRERLGRSFRDVIDKRAEEESYAAERGVALATASVTDADAHILAAGGDQG